MQRVESLAMRDVQDIANGDEPLFVDRFVKNNYFDAALHEGGM